MYVAWVSALPAGPAEPPTPSSGRSAESRGVRILLPYGRTGGSGSVIVVQARVSRPYRSERKWKCLISAFRFSGSGDTRALHLIAPGHGYFGCDLRPRDPDGSPRDHGPARLGADEARSGRRSHRRQDGERGLLDLPPPRQ